MTSIKTEKIDRVLLHPFFGYVIFLLIIWFTFFCTFTLGNYPMELMEEGVAWLADFAQHNIKEGLFNDLIVQGVIGGVGGVIVFLPNILILFLFISLMEETGYMERMAHLTEGFMHKIGLHGRSFIPLIMGFGCNVPAIMSARIIKDPRDRLVTILIIPFMSCSARLPVYIVITGTFFPEHASLVMFGLYVAGVVLAALFALLFKRTFNKANHRPYTETLPEYTMPKLSAVLRNIGMNAGAYLKKMGGIVLIASILLWGLMYFPQRNTEQVEQSYIAKVGKVIEPVMKPIGFDWKISVSLLCGVAAKELIVSNLGVLYSDNPETSTDVLGAKLKAATYPPDSQGVSKPVFTIPVALSFLFFTLVYFPCSGVFAAVAKESGWKWAVFIVTYTTIVAWVLGFAVFHIAQLII